MTTADVRPLRVAKVQPEAQDVISVHLVRPGGGELAPWSPGAHLDLLLPSGLVRQYSLCGDPLDKECYRVAVLREAEGRGGSRELHDSDLVGREIGVRGPRNHFRLVEAPSYLFLAGGIGITPLLAMARDVSRRGLPWRLVYGGRSRATMAFVDELLSLPGGQLELVPQDEVGLLPLDEILGQTPATAAVYACGPEPMLRAVEQACDRHLPPGVLHIERFSSSKTGPPDAVPAPTESEDFDVVLQRTGVTVSVPPDRTILEVVREVVPDVLSSCEEGFCGACETTVLEGVPEHRDTILTDEERERSGTMMICVGRSCSKRLVLDL